MRFVVPPAPPPQSINVTSAVLVSLCLIKGLSAEIRAVEKKRKKADDDQAVKAEGVLIQQYVDVLESGRMLQKELCKGLPLDEFEHHCFKVAPYVKKMATGHRQPLTGTVHASMRVESAQTYEYSTYGVLVRTGTRTRTAIMKQ